MARLQIVRGQVQYLDMVGVFKVDCRDKEMVKPNDLSILPDLLGTELFPHASVKVVVGAIMSMPMDRENGRYRPPCTCTQAWSSLST